MSSSSQRRPPLQHGGSGVGGAITLEEDSYAWLADAEHVFVPVRIAHAFDRGAATGGAVVKLKVNEGLPFHDHTNAPPAVAQRVSGRISFGSFTSSRSSAKPTSTTSSAAVVQLSSEQTSSANLIRTDAKALSGISDMISSTEISEASMLHNLRVRFHERRVYTAIGSLLVSVNPFHALPLYTPEMVEKYRAAGSVAERNALPPHVFAMADLAYNNLVRHKENQSCIISGESGSGKTEFAKLFLQYLMDVSNTDAAASPLKQPQPQRRSEDDNVDLANMPLATKIMTATRVMEAFGNAKTAKNDNSSRHGKWLAVKFHSKRGTVIGAQLQTYLLEKSRLVDTARANPQERNFHILYQVLAGAENDWALEESLQLKGGWEAFAYLRQGGNSEEEDTSASSSYWPGATARDSRAFDETIRALRVLGMTGEEEGQVLSVLAGVLHLGNVRFHDSSSSSSSASMSSSFSSETEVANPDVLAVASELLGLDSELVAQCLTKKDLSNAKETLFQNRTLAQAAETRDALAKFAYSQLFDYVVLVCNRALVIGEDDQVASSARSEIGILDIFGFEVLASVNSLEQLLINYANEALQEKFFNKFLFDLERQEYIRQGMAEGGGQVDALCAHVSTEECLRMFEDRATGLFSSLEDECALPQASDATFLSRFAKLATAQPYKCFAKPPGGGVGDHHLEFKIQHYAGCVAYSARQFLEKSRDRVDPSVENLALSSTELLGEISKLSSSLLLLGGGGGSGRQSLTPQKKRTTMNLGGGGGGGSSPSFLQVQQQQAKTLGTKFVQELGGLIDSLGQTQPHFARCIKPNDARSATQFQSHMVMSQMRYSGLLDVCRVRRSGYPVRIALEDFAWRYRCLLPSTTASTGGDATTVARDIFDRAVLPSDGFFGRDKVLLRDSARDYLDFQRETKLKRQVVLIQKAVRGKLARQQLRGTLAKLARLDALATAATSAAAAAAATATVSSSSSSSSSFSQQDFAAMDGLLAELSEGVSPFHCTMVKSRQAKLLLERQNMVLTAIGNTESGQEAQVVKREAMSNGIGERDPVLHRINQLLQNKSDSQHMHDELEAAMDTRDLAAIERALLQALAHATTASPQQLDDARALRDRLVREQQALDALERAMRAEPGELGRMDTLRTSLHVVMGMGMETHPVAMSGMKLLKKWKRTENESRDMSAFKLQGTEDARRALERVKAASNEGDIAALQRARHDALELGLDRRADVQRAGRLLREMDQKSDLETQLDVATDFLMAKADLKSGLALTAKDLETHAEAVYVAKQWQIPNTATALIRAQMAESRCRAQLRLQGQLVDALQEKDFDRMRALLVETDKLALDNDLVRRARAVSSNRNGGGADGVRWGRTSSTKDTAREMTKMSELEYEKQRMVRLVEARKDEHDWWDLEKKGIMRSSESFARKKGAGGYLLSTVDRKVQQGQLKWSGEVIPKSMTLACGKSNDRLCKRAVLMNKALLGFCGDVVLPYPSVLAQQMLEAALLDPPLQDELWVQLMKQLTLNPYAASERKAWMLCCICSMCVGPCTLQVENAVLNFLAFQVQLTDPKYQDPLHREYARFALRKFERTVVEGPSGRIPTEEEIDAFAKRPPMLASICLPDGSELAREMPVCPDVTVGEVVETCCQTYGLAADNSFMFGLFKELDHKHVTDRRTRRLKRMDTCAALETLTGDKTASSSTSAATPARVLMNAAAANNNSVPHRASSAARRPSLLQRVSLSITRVVRHTPAPPPSDNVFPGDDAADDVTVFQQEAAAATATREAEGGAAVFSPGSFSTTRRRASILSTAQARDKTAYVVNSSKAKLKPQQHDGAPARAVLPLNQDDFLGDVLARHVASGQSQLVFIFRRALVYAAGEEPAKAQTKDKGAYLSLCYLDAVEEVLNGNWALPSKDAAAEFAALIMAEIRKGQVPAVISPALGDHVHAFLPAEWHDKESAESWGRLVTQALRKLRVSTGKDCRRALLVEAARLSPTFGQIPFRVRLRRDAGAGGGEEDVVFGCGVKGVTVHQAAAAARAVLMHYPHVRVRKVGATADTCTIHVWDDKHVSSSEAVVLVTQQGHEIAALLWEFGIKCQQ